LGDSGASGSIEEGLNVNRSVRGILLLAVLAVVPACGDSGGGGGGAGTGGASASPAAGSSALVSVGLPIPANSSSNDVDITPDGKYVVFSSFASNLVPNDTNNANDVFWMKVLGTGAGEIRRVSLPTGGGQANEGSYAPSISDDGRYVCFTSYATNLVSGDSAYYDDVFVHDTLTGTTTLATLNQYGAPALHGGHSGKISGDGSRVVFLSYSNDLTADLWDGYTQVYVRDLITGQNTRLSFHAPPGFFASVYIGRPDLSSDGSYVTYHREVFDWWFGNFDSQVYLRDVQGAVTSVVSVDTGGVTNANNTSSNPSISADGNWIAFQSYATNLVAGGSNGYSHIFVRDMTMALTVQVSVNDGGAEADDYSFGSRISADGGFVVFSTYGKNLGTSPPEPADINGYEDIYIRDLAGGTTRLLSKSTGNEIGNSSSYQPGVADGGRYVVFVSYSDNLVNGDTNFSNDIFFHDRDVDGPAGTAIDTVGNFETSCLTFLPGQSDDHSFLAAVSQDGDRVAYESQGRNLATGDQEAEGLDVFGRDRSTKATTLVSAQALPSAPPPSYSSVRPSISAGGGFIAFESNSDRITPGDGNGVADIFIRDLDFSTTTRVSVDTSGNDANGGSYAPSINRHSGVTPGLDGRYVAFESDATDLVVGDTNGVRDIFLRDITGGTTVRVSLDSGGTQANGHSFAPSVSGDGTLVAFCSYASNLVAGDTNGVADIFVKNVTTGAISRISTTSSGAQVSGGSTRPVISENGNVVAFLSVAADLVPGDGNGVADVFVKTVSTGAVVRASVGASGEESDAAASNPSLSGDGRMVAWDSAATNLTGDESLGFSDVFVRDLLLGTTVRASVNTDDGEADGDSVAPALSGDGLHVAFYTSATNIIEGDVNGKFDVVIRGPLR
jgi:Tol biopolymer transport system component